MQQYTLCKHSFVQSFTVKSCTIIDNKINAADYVQNAALITTCHKDSWQTDSTCLMHFYAQWCLMSFLMLATPCLVFYESCSLSMSFLSLGYGQSILIYTAISTSNKYFKYMYSNLAVVSFVASLLLCIYIV